jgi:enoyl-CoA hydratase/carnithine racemase
MGSITEEAAEAGIVRLWLDDPGRRNALDDSMIEALVEALERLGRQPLHALVLRGRGGHFCAGRNISGSADADEADHHRRFEGALRLQRAFAACPIPVIGVVEGYAVGFGVSLALWCDVALAAADAVFIVPEVLRGIPPTLTAVTLLRHLPRRQALDLMLTGRRCGAEEAASLGLVTRAVPTGGLEVALEDSLAALRRASPDALRLTKRLVTETEDAPLGAAMATAVAISLAGMASPDAAEGARAFQEKRPPRWPSLGDKA